MERVGGALMLESEVDFPSNYLILLLTVTLLERLNTVSHLLFSGRVLGA